MIYKEAYDVAETAWRHLGGETFFPHSLVRDAALAAVGAKSITWAIFAITCVFKEAIEVDRDWLDFWEFGSIAA